MTLGTQNPVPFVKCENVMTRYEQEAVLTIESTINLISDKLQNY